METLGQAVMYVQLAGSLMASLQLLAGFTATDTAAPPPLTAAAEAAAVLKLESHLSHSMCNESRAKQS